MEEGGAGQDTAASAERPPAPSHFPPLTASAHEAAGGGHAGLRRGNAVGNEPRQDARSMMAATSKNRDCVVAGEDGRWMGTEKGGGARLFQRLRDSVLNEYS